MARVVIVANRLASSVKLDDGHAEIVPSAGGLATGLRGVHERSGGLWIGWPGDTTNLDATERERIDRHLAADGAVPVHLSQEEITQYYDTFSNAVLWPLFHYQLDRIPADARSFEAYRAVNERFAEITAAQHRPGDILWIHDYQLMLVPAMLRRRVPEARIGFFLHTPFPSTDVFRTLPWRDAILEGLLGADLIGFHAFSYARHFANSILRVLGVETGDQSLSYDGRDIRFGVFPMGIDSAAFSALGDEPGVQAEAHGIREAQQGQRLLLGVDRLDYTKGIPRRLLAFERLLETTPDVHGKVRLAQLAVPSRADVKEYERARRDLDEIVGRVNGKFGTVKWTPIQYLYRSVSRGHLVALYRAADVMVVTPLRDGMNLVAKEFVASRTDTDGVLVLSELAGAAAELGEALLVNPYDIDGTAAALRTALAMPKIERQVRMMRLRRRVALYDTKHWADQFLDALERATTSAARPTVGLSVLLLRLAIELQRGADTILLLDYDGTLVSTASAPDLALPDADVLALLERLARSPRVRVHVVSGRPREWLEASLGKLPVALHAEHGLFYRADAASDWRAVRGVPVDWKERVRGILEEAAMHTPGAFVEEKAASLTWHYRLADPEYGLQQAKELRLHLGNLFANAPIEVQLGDRVIDVRAIGVNKGLVVDALGELPPDACILAMGNDRTDEDMFAALPESAFTVHVGIGTSRARYRLPNPAAARAVLRELATRPPPPAASSDDA